MKKIITISVISISLLILSSCNSGTDTSNWSAEKQEFMSTCDAIGNMTEYCECCYDKFVDYGAGERYLEEIEECMGYLY